MNRIKARLQAGEFITAAWVDLGSPEVAELMVRHGWQVLVIDGEHGAGDLEQWVAVARAIAAAGGEAILRVPHGDPALLKRVLDRGFTSIIVPMVDTADQARAIAEACLYPGQGGRRGYGASLARVSGFGARADYVAEARDELLLILQCESAESVGNLDGICAVEGVGMVFIGPNDLSGTLGCFRELDSGPMRQAIGRIEATCRAAGMPLGTITGGGRGWADLRALGYGLAVGEADVPLLAQAARAAALARDRDLAE